MQTTWFGNEYLTISIEAAAVQYIGQMDLTTEPLQLERWPSYGLVFAFLAKQKQTNKQINKQTIAKFEKKNIGGSLVVLGLTPSNPFLSV